MPGQALGLALLAWLLVVIPGCGSTSTLVSDPTLSGVGIEAMGCGLRAAVGSGAVVSEAGLVVTVAHTVAGAEQIVVIDDGGQRHEARLRLLDPASDIALLEVDGLAAPALPLAPSADVPAEGDLLVWNRSGGVGTKPVEITGRLLVTIEDIYLDLDVERTAYELAGSIEVGDSGGVIVVDGIVVGMVYARARDNAGRGFALDERELDDAINGQQAPEVDVDRCVP